MASIRLVTLDEVHLNRFSRRDLRDVVGYFPDSVYLLTGDPSPRQVRWFRDTVESPVLQAGNSARLRVKETELILLGEGEPPVPSEDSPDQRYVFSRLVEREMDPHSMSMSWSGQQQYARLLRQFGPVDGHLTPSVPAGETREPPDLDAGPLHGCGAVETRNGVAIPSLRLDHDHGVFREELLDSRKLGLQAIAGLGWKRARRLQRHGYETREDLVQSRSRDLLRLDNLGPYYACVAQAGAHALERSQAVWFDQDPLADVPRAFVDIETDSTRVTNIWQIGVYDEPTDEYRYFLQTREPGDPRPVPRAFARWVHREASDRTFVAWYGSKFDFPWLDRFIEEHAEPRHRTSWESCSKVDLLEDLVRPRTRLPARSHKLDVVARRLGYDRNQEGLDGSDAARAYARWRSGEVPDWDRWIRYCRDDVMAMAHVYETLRESSRLLDRAEIERTYRRMNRD